MHKLSKESVIALCQKKLKDEGLKITKQRQMIIDYVIRSSDHVSCDQMYLDLVSQHLNIGRATVFRTIGVLDKHNLVSSIFLRNGTKVYECQLIKDHHDHMICILCQRIIEFQSDIIEDEQERIVDTRNFVALWHSHQIFGYCAKCSKMDTVKL